MKKIALLLLLAATHIVFAGKLFREEYHPKPMVEGNRRVDELIAWNKEHPGQLPPLTEQEKYELEKDFDKLLLPL